MSDAPQSRIAELERLVSELRHDIRGALSPAMLIADRLRQNPDPSVQKSGHTIDVVVQRILKVLDATREAVPARDRPPGRT